MRRYLGLGALTCFVAAMLTGCGADMGAQGAGDGLARDSAGDLVVDAAGAPVRYRLLGADDVPAAITASTTENAWHPATAAVDGNVTTAWAPLWNDAAPALTFDFGTAVELRGLTIRVSPSGVKVAVATWNGSGWTTVASGLSPADSVSTLYALPDLPTTKARLTFSGVHPALLYVCEAAFQGGKAACPDPVPE